MKRLLAEAAELSEEERAERVLRGESNGKAVDDAGLAAIFYGHGGPAT